jgi:hypothetical protein
LQECIYTFSKMTEEAELEPLLERLARRRPIEFACSDATEAHPPSGAGRLSVALGRTFPIIDPKIKNPESDHW